MLKKCFTLFFLVQTTFVFSQQNSKIDSLLQVAETNPNDSIKINALGRLFFNTLWQNPEQAKLYALREIELAKKNNYKPQLAMSYYHLGYYYNNIIKNDSAKFYYHKSVLINQDLGDFEKEARANQAIAIIEYSEANYEPALEITNKSIALYKKLDSTGMALGVMYDFKGQVLSSKGEYDKAIASILKALKILEPLNKSSRTADALSHLGEIELKLENHQKAIEYFEKALAIYKKTNDVFYQAVILSIIGKAHFDIDNTEKAIAALEESIEKAKLVKQTNIQASAMGYLAEIYTRLENYSKAIQLSKESIRLLRSTNANNELVGTLNILGNAYISEGNPSSALPYLKEAIDLSKSMDSKSLLSESYLNRSIAYEKAKKTSLALIDYKLYKALNDSIFNTEKSKQIEELRARYDTEKKEQQIKLQDNEIDILEQKAKISSLQKLLLGIGLLLSLIAIGFGFYGFKQRIKRNKAEKEKLDNELAFKKKELTTHALHLAKKNEVLEDLKQKAEILKTEDSSNNGYQQLIRAINFDLQDDKNWDNFSRYFEEVHQGFSTKAKQEFPDITANDLRLMALLKMNLSSKEIANILSISSEGIKKARYRLRKKLHLSTEDSLEDFILAFA